MMSGSLGMIQKLWQISVLVGVKVGLVSCHSLLVAENETEVSFFNRSAYEIFKHNPEVRKV